MTVAECFCLTLGLVLGLISGYVVGDSLRGVVAKEDEREQRRMAKIKLHQLN